MEPLDLAVQSSKSCQDHGLCLGHLDLLDHPGLQHMGIAA